MIGNDYKILAVDFDNTIFETEYPTILRPISPVIEMAKERRARGDRLILWTCREGAELDAAVEACRAEGLEFDAVNDNLPEEKAKWGNNPRKVAADEYWDDKIMYPQIALDSFGGLWFTMKNRKEIIGELLHNATVVTTQKCQMEENKSGNQD